MAASQPPDNFIRVHQALQYAFIEAAPTLEHDVKTWHSTQINTFGLQQCSQPQVCSTIPGKPKQNVSCQNCVQWAQALESVYYPQPAVHSKGGIPIVWKNVNATLLYSDFMQVTTGFALCLPSGKRLTKMRDYDTASILKIMLGFGEFHHYNTSTRPCPDPCKVIRKVVDIRNHLSHFPLQGSLHISEQDMKDHILDIKDFVFCLEILNHITGQQATQMQAKLDQIQSSPALLTFEIQQAIHDVIQYKADQIETLLIERVENTITDAMHKHGQDQDGELGNMYLEKMQQNLSGLYKQKYGRIQLLPSISGYTEDMFLEPKIAYALGKYDGKIHLQSCNELLTKKDEFMKHIVLVGNAGCGKSTVLHNKLAYDWAKGLYPEIRLLFAINACEIVNELDVVDIVIEQLLSDEKMDHDRDNLDKLMRDNADFIVFLIDGLDEIPKNLKDKQTGLTNLLLGKRMQGSQVIVSSRPFEIAKFQKEYGDYTVVYLRGFSEETVKLFTGKIMSKSDVVSFLTALQRYPPCLSWLKTNPLTLAMLCILWKENKELPIGLTAIYQEIIEYLDAHMHEYESQSENLTQVIINIGKYALQNLIGEKTSAILPDCFEIARHLGICSVEHKREKYSLKPVITFPLHKSIQEYCAAVYLADLFVQDKDEFLAYMTKIDGMENLLRFCCGLSADVMLEILRHVVNQNTDEILKADPQDMCIFGIGFGVKNPWKLPLLLAYEAEVQNRENLPVDVINKILTPLVNKIHMNCRNWPVDVDIYPVLVYFMYTNHQTNWLSYVQEATIVLKTTINMKSELSFDQTRLVSFMTNLDSLHIKSSRSQIDCNSLLQNLHECLLSLGGCNTLKKLSLYRCQLKENVLTNFLSLQKSQMSVTLDNSILYEEVAAALSEENQIKTDAHQVDLPIKSLSELIIIDSSKQTFSRSFLALMSKVYSPLILSLEWKDSTVDSKTGMGEQAQSAVEYLSISGQSVTQQRSAPTHVGNRMSSHGQKGKQLGFFDLSQMCLLLARLPALNKTLTELTLSGFVVSLPSLYHLCFSHQNLSVLSLRKVILTGHLQIDTVTHCSKILKKCTLIEVEFVQNLFDFLWAFSIVSLVLDNVSIDISDNSVNLTNAYRYARNSNALHQIELLHCNLTDARAVLFLILLPPFAHLQLTQVYIGQNKEYCKHFSGFVNTLWAYCHNEFISKSKYVSLHSMDSCLLRSRGTVEIIPHCYIKNNSATMCVVGLLPDMCENIESISVAISASRSLVNVMVCDCFINVRSLEIMLTCMPQVAMVNVDRVTLIDDIEGLGYISLSYDSYKVCCIRDSVMSDITMMKVLACIPSEKTVKLDKVKLIVEMYNDKGLLCESFVKFEIGVALSAYARVKRLTSIPSIRFHFEIMNFTDVMLTGQLETKCKSPDEFKIGGTLNTNTMVKLLSLKPTVQTIKLTNVVLTGQLESETPINFYFLQNFVCSSCDIDCHILAYLLSSCPYLNSLSWTEHKNHITEEEIQQVFSTLLPQAYNLRIIKLDDTTLLKNKHSFKKPVVTFLDACIPNLQELTLSHAIMDERHCAQLFTLISNAGSNAQEEIGNPRRSVSTTFVRKLDQLKKSFNQATVEPSTIIPLQTFDISGNNIGSAVDKLVHTFQSFVCLRILRLGYCGLQYKHIKKISKSLSFMKLQEIDLSGNKQIMPMLSPDCPNLSYLVVLKLENTGLTDDDIKLFQLLKLSTLTELDISHNVIGSKGALALAQALSAKCMPLLTNLNLANNRMNSIGVNSLSKAFVDTPLTTLNLACNSICSDGATILAQSISTLQLQSLDLSDNNIGSNGAAVLGQSFQHLPLLKELYISRNTLLVPQGVVQLFRNLIHLPSLVRLDLTGIELDDEMCSHFPVLMECLKAINKNFSQTSKIDLGCLDVVQIKTICETVKREQFEDSN